MERRRPASSGDTGGPWGAMRWTSLTTGASSRPGPPLSLNQSGIGAPKQSQGRIIRGYFPGLRESQKRIPDDGLAFVSAWSEYYRCLERRAVKVPIDDRTQVV